MRRNILQTSSGLIRVLLALTLMLNGAVAQLVPVADAAPADAAQSQHHGHEGMTGMAMDGDPTGLPATDCCDGGCMNCQCGCIFQQPGALRLAAPVDKQAAAPAVMVLVISRHTSNSATTPFRPPA